MALQLLKKKLVVAKGGISRTKSGLITRFLDDASYPFRSECSADSSSHSFLHQTTVDAASCLLEEESKEQKNFKFNKRKSITIHRLHFPEGSLAGREEEIALLLDSFLEHLSRLKQIKERPAGSFEQISTHISVSGPSGTGKTVFAKILRKEALRSDGFFCIGKFELYARNAPYTAFALVFDDLVDQIFGRGEASANQIRVAIVEAIGAEAHLLMAVAPAFSRLLPDTSESSPASSTSLDKKTNQLHFIVRQVVRAISRSCGPLVLVMDDVQWADQQSLDLMDALLTDRDSSFVLVTTSRTNEVDEAHIFTQKVELWKDHDAVHCRAIEIDCLGRDAVCQIVADALRSNMERVRKLADIVYNKTAGNAFFVAHFLQSLVDEGHLTFNFGLMEFVWTNNTIDSLKVSANVADLLAAKIQKLPEECRVLLQVAACLGQDVEETVLELVLEHLTMLDMISLGDDSLTKLFAGYQICVAEGLLEKNGRRLAFAHDQIQAASFALIGEDKLAHMQMEIGRCLLSGRGEAQTDQMLFLAVDLYNESKALLHNSEMVDLATCNLLAAERAGQKSAFGAASSYAEAGLQCIGKSSNAETIEDLQFKLSVIATEASYCIGDLDKMEEHATMALASQHPFLDKFRVLQTKVLVASSQLRYDEAIEHGVSILRQLGMKNLSCHPGSLSVIKEVLKTNLVVKGLDKESLRNLPTSSDNRLELASSLMHRLSVVAYSCRPKLFLVLYLRAVRIAVKHGVTKASPPAFAAYGMILCGMLRKRKQGAMMGEVALALIDRLGAREGLACTLHIVFAYIHPWTHDLRDSIKPIKYGINVGFENGDIYFACNNTAASQIMAYQSGTQKLHELEPLMLKSLEEFRNYKQNSTVMMHSIVLQAVLNVMGKADDPLVLTGTAMDYDEFCKTAKDNKYAFGMAHRNQLLLLIRYEAYDMIFERLYDMPDWFIHGPSAIIAVFFEGMAYAGFAQEGRHIRKHCRKAKKQLAVLERCRKAGNPNGRHLVRILQAEIAAIHNKKSDSVAAMFEEAIKLSGRSGYIHDKALCHARAGRYFFEKQKDSFWAAHHIDSAIQAYEEWGAAGVARYLINKYQDLLASYDNCSFTSRDLLSESLSLRVCRTSRRVSHLVNSTRSFS